MKTHQVVLIILAILAQCKNPQAMNLKINPAYDQFRKDSVSGFTFPDQQISCSITSGV